MNIRFIGLAFMGRPMAEHLIKAGHRVALASRSGAPSGMINGDVIQCATAADAATDADIIITMAPDTRDVEAVLFGNGRPGAGHRGSPFHSHWRPDLSLGSNRRMVASKCAKSARRALTWRSRPSRTPVNSLRFSRSNATIDNRSSPSPIARNYQPAK